MRRMVTSTLACVVSVKRRNFMPVRVQKHCARKFSVSRTSSPEGGSGRFPGAAGGALIGFRRAVIAWILYFVGCVWQRVSLECKFVMDKGSGG